ncbi:LOW QUALITY PROTEIN: alanine--glyoxylate aminotransferase 2, mitochondrial-like [Liolophura sinensis]|uniref:LOW QUALITY PROTEIN: alanine--glyoxylate aminotransferase 2, mitochondrial-like n=1 Tax=Liolophura sinensis TaxID=3198878 RepID=UPI0031583188
MSLFCRSIGYVRRAYATAASVKPSSVSQIEMPPCDFTPDKYTGPSYEEALRIRKGSLFPMLTYYKKPLMLHQGYMQWLFDMDGRRYLDLFGGIVTVSVGHCHPKVLAAAGAQMKKLWHTTNIYLHPAVHEYAEKLAAKMPGNLKVVMFANSGSEANDMAIHLARLHTGVFEIVSTRNAYHGASPHLMGLTALNTWRYNVPTGFGIHQTMNPDPYRGPWGGARCRDSPAQTGRSCDCPSGQCAACDMYVDQFEDVLRFSVPKGGRVAGFFAESIQGVGGSVQFPKDYLKKTFQMVRERGGVCISDEVQTGFGRTGTHYWGFEGHGVIPDIVTMAKGIGNGFPLAALVTTPEIAASYAQALHFNTFGGNPMASAVGSAVLDVIEEDGCQQTSHEVGTYFLQELDKLRDEIDIIGDVRGKGLMIGVEMVKNKETREPLDAETMGAIWEKTKDMGLLVGKGGLYGNVFRIKPPMCITQADVNFALSVIREAIVCVTS